MKKNFLIDPAIAIGLTLALVVVYNVEQAWRKAPSPAPPPTTKTETIVNEPFAKPLRLAVTIPEFDDMGALLRKLGDGYSFQTIEMGDLDSPTTFSNYDVIFATCASRMPDSWFDAVGNRDVGRGAVQVRLKEDVLNRVKTNVRKFVENGGTLYLSDWQMGLLKIAFPEFVSNDSVNKGAEQTLTAEVADAGLRDLIGNSLSLKFDLGGWFPAAIEEKSATVYLRGRYRSEDGDNYTSPLLVKIRHGDGIIIFTSFHNEKQNSEKELTLLRYLVFAAVTAKEVSKAEATLVQGGFSPQKQNLLSASAEAPSVTQTYQNKEVCNLRFVLGFTAGGAKLRLNVVGPNGESKTMTDQSSFTISFDNASKGDWKYTIVAEKVPYENFPYSLTIGAK